MSSIKLNFFPLKLMGGLLMPLTKVGLKSKNQYKSTTMIEKSSPMLLKIFLSVFTTMYLFLVIKIQLNHYQAIQGDNETLDEKCNKLVFKPYPMFKFNQGQRNVGSQLEIS
jgi:hypothetical protein